ncbi:MAG: preprotein translocase subunit SecG [Patescibacteria group bacterium]
MKQILNIVEIILAVALTTVILLQSRGAGLSTVFGGEGNIYRTRRGFEKALFIATIVLAVLFFGVAFATVVIVK